MILTLEVTGDQAEKLGAQGRRVFNAIGGTIGRLPDNDWVFPDPYISGRHALIRYVNGKFFIEDTSTNGICVNSAATRVSKTQAHPLKDGDVLFIDAYRIRVNIEDDAAQDKARKPGRSVPVASPEGVHLGEDRTESMAVRASDEETEWFGSSEAEAVSQAHVQPLPQAALAPQEPVVRGGRRASDVPAATADGYMYTLLASAGMEGVTPSHEIARVLGEVLQVCVQGTMEALRARERIKDELRVRGTTFKPAHNNPLKLSVNVEDAFHNLLVKHNPAYLGPADAFAEAFADVREHQTALLRAMRLAFESMLAQFDPERLQEEFERPSKKGSILGGPAKLRYWEMYKDKYGDITKDAESAFRSLFADEFARAYEAQLERMRAMSRLEPR